MSADESRIHQRSPIELAASYGISDESIANEVNIINFSTGGFCFYSTDNINCGKEIVLEIEVEEGELIKLNVKVVWAQKIQDLNSFMIGVQIQDTEGDDYRRFLNFHAEKVL